MLRLLDEQLAVEREDDVALGFELQVVEDGRAPERLVDKSQVVHQNVAHHVNLAQLGALAIGNAVVAGSGGEEHVAQAVDHQPVDFLGHRDVEAAGSGSDMH